MIYHSGPDAKKCHSSFILVNIVAFATLQLRMILVIFTVVNH